MSQKPAKSAREFLERRRDHWIEKYLKATNLHDELELSDGYFFLKDVTLRAVDRQFRDDIKEAHQHWGWNEINDALKEMRSRDYHDQRITQEHITEFVHKQRQQKTA